MDVKKYEENIIFRLFSFYFSIGLRDFYLKKSCKVL